jgi:hypothetical protein
MLNEISVKIDELLLDPNNPRLMDDINRDVKVDDENLDDKDVQEKLLGKFRKTKSDNDEENFTEISDLWASMTTVGYVPIDRIVVRSVANSGKYLVVEGNRRVATLKRILRVLNAKGADEKFEKFRKSYESFNCIQLITNGLDEQEIANNIAKVLGLRHHGSLKEWDPLPSAFDIYKQYMGLLQPEKEFKWDNKIGKEVASRLSIPNTKVRTTLSTYVAFRQLKELFAVKERHYSLIQVAVTNGSLKSHLFDIDEPTFRLSEVSLAKMNDICQFETRDELDNEKKIIPDPKTFTKLGKIYSLKHKNPDIVGSYADALLTELYEWEKKVPIDTILDLVTSRINQSKWIEQLENLLIKQREELPITDYSGAGNDRGNKDALVSAISPILKVMDLT